MRRAMRDAHAARAHTDFFNRTKARIGPIVDARMLMSADRLKERPLGRDCARCARSRKEDTVLEHVDRLPYEAPLVLDTFDAHEVMGSAEGIIGCGSQVPG